MTSRGSERVLSQGCPNTKFQLAIPTYLSNMLQYGKKGEVCNLDIGTNKENMATVKWPRFSGFYWLRGRRGEKVFCFCESWRSPRISLCVGGGDGHSGAGRV